MLLELIQRVNEINEKIFSPIDELIEGFAMPEWVADAIIDSLHMVPFLLFIFFVIGVLEYFYSNKTKALSSKSKIAGPIVGSLIATVPQCGFSVIASTLYSNLLITKGTLLAVYLATSDEALPVLLAEPDKINLVLPLLGTKILIALVAGYIIDLIFRNESKTLPQSECEHNQEHHSHSDDEGCCRHSIHGSKRSLFLHPIIHTLNIFVFILIVTLVINFAVDIVGGEENLGKYLLNDSFVQPIITALFGLIPNCAVSVAITLMYMKGAIGFGSVVSGLCSSAGLGLLVLLKRNKNRKDTALIIGLLLGISILAGMLIQILIN